MERASLTVGMCVQSSPDGLRRSVPTVFGQTWDGPTRLVVVDYGDSDETRGVLDDLTGRYGRIEVIRLNESLGRSAARNTILEHAGDGYVAWIDAGDLWHPRKLEVQFAALAEAESRDDGPVVCVGPFSWNSTELGDQRVRIPDVDGDQLYGALTGRIFPYLQAILGRAEYFNVLGGFDTRLLRRQDYDMLVRFVGAGGRVVSSRPDVPVFTHLKSHFNASAEAVAEANRVLRDKHRAYHRAYGWRLAQEVRNNQHRQTARFYRDSGSKARSVGYETLGALTSPAITARRVRQRVWQPRRAARAVARLPLRMVRPVLPVLQRTEVMELVRRAGAFKLMSLAGVDRRLIANLRAEVEDTSGSSPVPTLRGGRIPPEAEQLEAEVTDSATVVPQEKWLELELIYRRHSLLHSAESALRRGLDQYPGNAVFLVRLVELQGLGRYWAECVETWESCDDRASLPIRGLTAARLARSYRELERYEDALRVAESAAQHWRDDFRVADELYICRAAVVDWKHALRPASTEGDRPDPANGYVTDAGFLAGADGPLTGRVARRWANTVSLVVNGTTIASTQATSREPGTDWNHYSLSAHEVLRYVGDGDVVWVESEGGRMAVNEYASSWRVTTGYPSRVGELQRELSGGHVFTKRGTLRMGNTRERRDHTLALFDEVSSRIKRSHGYVSYPLYGQLLGAIREHGLIAHDAGGFDMGYVSMHSTPEAVRTEFMDILRMLVDLGYHLRLEPWSAYVRPDRTTRIFVDLNYGWFNEAGELNFSFGWRHDPVTDRDWFELPRHSLIGDRPVRVPGNAEAVLEQLYGATWAIPDQGFVLDSDIRRDMRFLLGVDEMRELEQLDPDRVVAIVDHHPHTRES